MKRNKKARKKKGFIIGIICGIILALGIAAAAILYIIFLPQVQVVDALTNTLSTAGESAIDQKYGGYAMTMEMLSGTYDIEVSYGDASSGIRRDKSENKFQVFADLTVDEIFGISLESIINSSFSLKGQFYVDSDTSVLLVGDKSIRLDYADHMTEKVENSFLGTLDIGGNTVVSAAEVYVELMEALSGTARSGNTFNELYERTLDIFLGLESEKLDKETFTINGKDVICQVYQITFNAEDLAVYVEDCYNISFTTGEKIDSLVELITGYSVDGLFDLAEEKAGEMQDLDVYFAVNSKQQLVSIYCKNVTDKDIDISLDFLGGDYLCDEVEFKWSDADGNGMTIVKDDISNGNRLSVEYEYTYYDRDGVIDEATLQYTFEDDQIILEQTSGDNEHTYTLDILSYEKGQYIEVAKGDYTVYLGCKTKDIENPEGDDTLNLLDAGILDAYSFLKDFWPGNDDEAEEIKELE